MRFFTIKKCISISIICTVLYLYVSSIDISQYREHHIPENTQNVSEVFFDKASIIRWPKQESWFIDMIDSSKKRVWISVYTFTLPSIREALLRAKDRGVDVRVLVEKFPYRSTGINRDTIDFLKNNNIPLYESNTKRFVFMHAKIVMIDDEWIIQTSNLTRSSYSKNREFYVRWWDSQILAELEKIFLFDAIWEWKGDVQDGRLMVWPTIARERLTQYLRGTNKTIDVYSPSFSDEGLLRILSELCAQKKSIRILIMDYPEESDQKFDTCFEVRHSHISLHAKGIIRDSESAFIGSFNYTKNSLENNREVGIFLSGEVMKSISQSFETDWKMSKVAQ